MESLEEQYGFDERIFLSEVPEYLHCMLCSLVLRDPVGILSCGHKICAPCFERFKTHSIINGNDLRCPIDRDLIDLKDVHEDVYLKRVIGNLVVRCYHFEGGCEWTGDLRELSNHISECKFMPQEDGETASPCVDMVKKLSSRLEKCEISLRDKDREIAALRDQVHEQHQLKTEIQDLNLQQQTMLVQISELIGKNLKLEQQLKLYEEGATANSKLLETQVTELAESNRRLQHEQEKQEEEITAVRDTNESLVSKTNELEARLETLQKKAEDNNDGSTGCDIDLIKESMGCKHFVKNKVPAAEGKKILVERHSGDPADATISHVKQSVTFRDEVNVSARGAIVPTRAKAWFEVKITIHPNTYGWGRIGWATNKLPTLKNFKSEDSLGGGDHSFTFSPFLGAKWNGARVHWGKKITGKVCVVGVALDLVNCEILFSVAGQWTAPMGVAFSGIPADIKLFPAFTGSSSVIEYNFGESAFIFGPPDPSFMRLIDVV